MATRLRFNGVHAALGASLTSSATSITFAAALTHSNGTAVPTLSNSYLALTILDGNGHLSEIVWLTAYTTGATTGTITRGQEGTTGVAHAAGDAIVHAPTALDLDGVVPTVVATTSNYWTGTNGSVTYPTGLQTGDLLVVIDLSSYLATTVSDGFQFVRAIADFVCTMIAVRYVDGTQGTSMTIGHDNSDAGVTFCFHVRNVIKLDAFNSASRGSTQVNTYTVGINNSGAGCLELAAAAYRVGAKAVTFDSPGTQLVQRTSDANYSSVAFARPAAKMFDTFTSTCTGTSYTGTAVISLSGKP